jgi:cellulose synthase/poly-beta-1,6-N-acetylglucosamine synthase-like glycosyltransferase
VGIAAFEEEQILARALDRLISLRYPDEFEIVVVAGGRDATIRLAESYAQSCRAVHVIAEDKRRGKPWALNRILSTARGEIIVLTDADVVIAEDAVAKLVAPFQDRRIGATCGRIVPLNNRAGLYDFWAHFLCEAAHDLRMYARGRRRLFHLTGYIYAVRRGIVERIPENSLAEDAMVGLIVQRRGCEIEYVSEATAFVMFPENLRDLLRQKARTRAGLIQLPLNLSQLRELMADELYFGLLKGLRFCRSLRELLYFLALSAFWRFVWVQGFWELKIKRRSPLEIWTLTHRPSKSTLVC